MPESDQEYVERLIEEAGLAGVLVVYPGAIEVIGVVASPAEGADAWRSYAALAILLRYAERRVVDYAKDPQPPPESGRQ